MNADKLGAIKNATRCLAMIDSMASLRSKEPERLVQLIQKGYVRTVGEFIAALMMLHTTGDDTASLSIGIHTMTRYRKSIVIFRPEGAK